MPPANSPTGTLTGTESVEYLEQFADLDEDVPDLSFSLTARAEEQANQENVSFLRATTLATEMNDGDETPLQAARRLRQMDHLINEQRRIQSERESARRLRRATLRHGMTTPSNDVTSGSTQGNNTASRDSLRRLGYQGWAPGITDGDMDEAQLTINELRALAHHATPRPSHDTPTRRFVREEELGVAGSLAARRSSVGPMDAEWQFNRLSESGPSLDHHPSEYSVRTTALLQSVRRQARFHSPRSWLPSTTLERERAAANSHREQRDRASDSSRLISNSSSPRTDLTNNAQVGTSQDPQQSRNRERQISLAALHMEKAIRYLHSLRFCESYSERLSFATEGGFMDGGLLASNGDRDDLVLYTSSIPPPSRCSWLRAGSRFNGSQKAHSAAVLPTFQMSTVSRRAQAGNSSDPRNISDPRLSSNHPQFSSGPRYQQVVPLTPLTTSVSRSWAPTISEARNSDLEDTWPVKVTIHSIDYDKMTLIGTMEAFNVPSKNSTNTQSTIATHLEGEIIDFNRYSLETKSFDANPKVDGMYWSQLEPFKNLTNEQLERNIVSRKWLSEELGAKYILMRWKEKCFITPADAQVHLTISGFYYISLRRSDGHIEGLYFDPKSAPYQHLSLTPANREFPSYGFR